ncbi:TIGR02594 family protein [Enterobacter cloacae]|uniref:TIGR02594 family protein n=1 Tax=Enterobacter cloacae TaxID=550 RepID=UPI000F815FC9|nr:TIGR02594 family protein [Enterobacter cloacae]MCQ4409855.1 TIGR02594 family protein [Enterobacter cloacae]MDK9962686.1 TIGR02594 family protein [Enterobacter cloacae]MDV0875924.1 TIGR02594 family protein [Enterobacter cloacae]MDV0890831.1 TIGR02594 family protein [Enterobacter cloacae]MDV0963077.1 TIGR02594 family protein [Enterobacter cloacae]
MRFVKATYHLKTKTVEYEAGDGTRLLKTAGTLSWRFNNPGNIIALPDANKQKGRIGAGTVYNPKKNTFVIFSSIEVGEREKCALLKRKYRDYTISDMMSQYAPETAGNDPVAYANFISSESGVAKDKKISDLNDNEFDKLVDAISKKEGGLKPGTEKWVYVTNVTVSDGCRPVADVPFKVILGSTTYEWKTDAYGKLKTIIHTKQGMAIVLKYTNSAGKEDVVYSAVAGDETKNILLTRNFSQFSAKTLAETPKVPREKSTQNPIEYIVMSGDSLSKIAERYKTSTDEIAKNNNIKNVSKIFPGQRLTIYGVNTSGPSVYIVSPGDTLAKISAKNGVSVDDIARQNNISDPNKIYPGQSLSISTNGSNAAGETEKPSVSSPASKPVNKKRQNSGINTNKKTLESVGGKNSGNPIALLPHEQREAPWMAVAFEEGETRWKWGRVKEGDGGINYHKKTGINMASMVGNSNPWCASFINYCLKEAGYSMSGSASSQSFKKNKNFIKISEPIYGAIVVLRKKGSWTGHVAFIYCLFEDGEIGVLGGNQGNSVTINPLYQVYINGRLNYELIGFYIPKSYYPYAQKIISSGMRETTMSNIAELRESLGANLPSNEDERTR